MSPQLIEQLEHSYYKIILQKVTCPNEYGSMNMDSQIH